MKNKKGFTLVELLAVIVVLSAVMLISVNSVLPLIGEARTGAFASSANQAIDSVSSVIISDELRGNNNIQCYSFKYLIEKGYLTRVEYANNDKTTGFDGIIVINKGLSTTANKYSIYLVDYSNGYYFAGTNLAAGTVDSDDVQAYEDTNTFYSTCASYSEANNLNWVSGTHYHD